MPQMDLFNEFNKLQRQIDSIENNTKRKIAREYANGLEKLRNIVRKKYDEYGVDGELTYQEMSKYNRIKKLDKEIADAVKDMHVQTSKMTRSSLRDTYKSTFSGVKGNLGEAAGRTIKGQAKREVINQALQNPVSGLTLNDRLKKRRRDIIIDIQEAVGQGIYRGESYTSMSNRLKETLEGDVVKARRIVSTETHRVMEKSKSEAAEYAANQGVKMKKYWLDSEDEAVRSSHEDMADKYDKENAIPVDEDFVNDETGGKGPAPGQLGVAEDDIYCRCIAIYIVVTDDN